MEGATRSAVRVAARSNARGVGPPALMQRLGVWRTTASQALSALADQGSARREGKGRASRYVPAE